jgi:hypothetical protein
MLREQVFPDPPSKSPPVIRMDQLSEPTPVKPERSGRDARMSDGIGLTEATPPPSVPRGYQFDLGRLTEPPSTRNSEPVITDAHAGRLRLGDGMDSWTPPERGIARDQSSTTISPEVQAKMLGLWVLDNHIRNAQSFPEQLKALWRQGREDFLHVLLHAFPDSMPLTREAGTPGEPTPQLITEGLTGRPVDLQMDR